MTVRTRAVVPVHLNGHPCDLEPIIDFCSRHGLHLIEDCAQAFGVRSAGQPVGRTDLGCFSLHPLKVFPGYGDGGFIAVADPAEADRLRELRNLGLEDRDHCRTASGNSRLDTIQAAMLLVGLDHVRRLGRGRGASTRQPTVGACPRSLRLPPTERPGELATYSAFVIRHPQRDRLRDALGKRGVDAKAHYPLAIHQQEAFADVPHPPLPVTERVVSEILSLPVHGALGAEDRDRVVAAAHEAVEELAR